MGEDPNEPEWGDETTPFHRVRSVIIAEEQPRSVAWIADEAVVTVEDCRDAFETLGRAGVIREVPSVGDEPAFESIPDTRLAVSKRAVRDQFDQSELRELRDRLAADVICEERPDTAAAFRLMAVEDCIQDVEEGR